MEQNTENSSLFELQIDHNGSAHLKETARWAKFLAIVGFIFCALIVLVALFAGSAFTFFLRNVNTEAFNSSGFGVMIAVVYILFAALYFFPCLFTYRFATKMQAALRSNDQEQLNQSFRNLKACYRYMGILTIIGLAFYAIVLIIVLIAWSFAPHVVR